MAKLSGKVAELARDAALADRAKMLAQRWTRSPNSITNLVGQFVLTGLAGNTSYMFRQGLDADAEAGVRDGGGCEAHRSDGDHAAGGRRRSRGHGRAPEERDLGAARVSG